MSQFLAPKASIKWRYIQYVFFTNCSFSCTNLLSSSSGASEASDNDPTGLYFETQCPQQDFSKATLSIIAAATSDNPNPGSDFEETSADHKQSDPNTGADLDPELEPVCACKGTF